MPESSLVQLEIAADGVATLTLNRPEKLNAFTAEMIGQWHAALLRVEADPAARVLVLTGAGRAFCAGGDAEEMRTDSEADSLERKHQLWRHIHTVALTMERLDKPSIAAINGAARGAGLDMALMCDLRVMAQSATLAETYINMGLVAGDGGAWYLPRLIGTDRALDLLWTGRAVAAEEAERIGLVTRIAPDEKVMDVACDMARAIASQPQEAIRMLKRAVYQGMAMPLTAHLDMISSHMSVIRGTEEHKARVAAFLNRQRSRAG